MPNTTTTLVQQRTSLFPPCLTELFTAANELSLATTATCRTIASAYFWICHWDFPLMSPLRRGLAR
jgi:hypothetical protein